MYYLNAPGSLYNNPKNSAAVLALTQAMTGSALPSVGENILVGSVDGSSWWAVFAAVGADPSHPSLLNFLRAVEEA